MNGLSLSQGRIALTRMNDDRLAYIVFREPETSTPLVGTIARSHDVTRHTTPLVCVYISPAQTSHPLKGEPITQSPIGDKGDTVMTTKIDPNKAVTLTPGEQYWNGTGKTRKAPKGRSSRATIPTSRKGKWQDYSPPDALTDALVDAGLAVHPARRI